MFENRTGCKKAVSSIQESAKSRNSQEEEVLITRVLRKAVLADD